MSYSDDFIFFGEKDNYKENIKDVINFHKQYGSKENEPPLFADFVCITCGNEIVHNYGTDEYPQCIICGNETE